ncbi:helix-turn-helix domain-containing protein [Pseudorhizobium flavum]|uniref:helix-turn-helix domain-containing protein n=1 Tax=Pseudorhizobium flavum TaxID=1335061 RepID=UPI0037703157
MNGQQLRIKLSGWNLTQTEFSQWLEVSPGAVNQWLTEARGVPGPVIAFIKLFESLPPSLQDRELSKIRKGNVDMEGMYVIEFVGSVGSGGATLTFKGGKVYGFDLGGGIYDGYYRQGAEPGITDIEVEVKMPAGSQSVIRGIIQPFDWNVIAKASIPTNANHAEVIVITNMGENVRAKFTRMRSLPLAA